MNIAIPWFGESVASCCGYSATISVFTIRGGRVADHAGFCLRSRESLDRVRPLRDQKVNRLICGGVQEPLEDVLQAIGIRVISWVSGRVEELLNCFLRDELVAGVGCVEVV